MTRFAAKDYEGTRAFVCRGSDKYVAPGWVQAVHERTVDILVPYDSKFEPGDVCSIELHGRMTSAFFEAIVGNPGELKEACFSSKTWQHESGATIIADRWLVLDFAIRGQAVFARPTQAFRVKLEGIKAVLRLGGQSRCYELLDVSENGFAVLGDEPKEPGVKVDFDVETPIGHIIGGGMLRNCIPQGSGHFRYGISIETLGRIDRPRWLRFVQSY
ncbi:MAG: PilZ domain-containing protein [Armatimonadetes bacterium]|nr:PilZ domain-containing protein [Armatimonadota bacterium]